ncbi:MAG: hypothetical protein ACLPVY_10625 [Acidimicrobiia bacterium]
MTRQRLGGGLLLAALLLVCVGAVVRNGEHAPSRTVLGPVTHTTDVSGRESR